MFQICPSVSALIRCHRALHYFIFHSRRLQIKSSSLFCPTADSHQQSPTVKLALFCSTALEKKMKVRNYHHLIYLTLRITIPSLRSHHSDLTPPSVLCRLSGMSPAVSLSYLHVQLLQNISRFYIGAKITDCRKVASCL